MHPCPRTSGERAHWARALGLCLPLLLLVQALPAPAQPPRAHADSLIALLHRVPADSHKVYMHRDIAYFLREELPEKALHHARRGESMATGLGLATGRIDNLFQQAFIWEEMDRHDSARACLFRSLKLARALEDPAREGKVLLSLGASYFFEGRLSEAIAHYDAALALLERIDAPVAQAYALNNLGIIYRLRDEHGKAIGIYERSLALKRLEGDTLGMANTLYNLGLAHAFSGDAGRALPCFAEARALYRKLGEDIEERLTDVGEGMALRALGRHAEARPLLERGLDLPERHVLERASALLHLGEADLAEGRMERGLQRLRSAHVIAAPSGRSELLRQVEKALASGHDLAGEPARAAPHWRAYAQLSDTLANAQRQWATEEMQARYESREKDMTIRAQEEALNQAAMRRRRNFAIALLLGALLVTTAIYARSRVRLSRRLQAAVDDREWLLREMHHRVKNNLQMLNSLLSMQSRALADSHARAVVQASQARVQAIGLIHQFLHGRDAFRNISMRSYLGRLLQQIDQVAGMDKRRLRLVHEVDDLQLDVDLATPIGLMVNELVTNALKHAFPDGRSGEVVVALHRTDGGLALTVRDNGAGTAGAGEGFGHTLLRTLARRLQAEVCVEHEGGTAVRVGIPISEDGKEPAHPGGRG